MRSVPPGSRTRLRPSLPWLALLVLVWWILAGPGVGAWVAGAVAVLIGFLVHMALGGSQGGRPTLRGLLSFVPFFLLQSFQGGVDVARRALSRRPDLKPGFLRYPMSLPEGTPRILFTGALSLLPGTFSAQFDGAEVRVHLLSDDGRGHERVRRLEEAVAKLFGVTSDPERRSPEAQ